MKTTLSLGLLASLLILPAQADLRRWSGDASGDWALPTNWQGNVFPSFSNDLLVFGDSPNKNLTQNLGIGLNVAKLSFSSPGYVLSGNRIDFQGVGAGMIASEGLTTINLASTYSGLSTLGLGTDVGSTLDINGSLSGTGGVNVHGEGFVRFDAAMTYSGETVLGEDSNLIVTGSTAGSLETVLRGTLHGSGTIGGDSADDVITNGAISPGDPQGDVTGDLTFNGDLTFSATGSISFRSYGSAIFDLQGNSAGVSYDQIDAAGAVVPGDARIILRADRGFAIGAVFTLIEKASIGGIASSRFA
jgi:hypothetical protein